MIMAEIDNPSISKSIERDIHLKDEIIHLKSVFLGQVKFENAILKILIHRLAEQKRIS